MNKKSGNKRIKISLITGNNDAHYQLDLLSGLVLNEIEVDFIGNEEMSDAKKFENVNFLDLRGDQNHQASIYRKIIRIIRYYFRILSYAFTSESRIYHIQWPNKFVLIDRTIVNIYYKLLNKKLVYTAHNIDEKMRDGKSSIINRWSLKFMYDIVDHIIVHTKKMKYQLIEKFNINKNKITVIEHGINNRIPKEGKDPESAKISFGIKPDTKTLLFFGNIAPYKGLDVLIEALSYYEKKNNDFCLLIAGKVKKGHEVYLKKVNNLINTYKLDDHIIKKIEFIKDEEIESFFIAADVLVLPYKYIFQSGIIFIAYHFGLPVIATDVGSLKEDIIEGRTGFLCDPVDPQDLSNKIELYFESDLYLKLEKIRKEIKHYATEKYSWEKIGKKTFHVYMNLISNMNSLDNMYEGDVCK